MQKILMTIGDGSMIILQSDIAIELVYNGYLAMTNQVKFKCQVKKIVNDTISRATSMPNFVTHPGILQSRPSPWRCRGM